MKNLKKATLQELNNFEVLSKDLYNFIRLTWKTNVKPKGYKKFTEDYMDFDGMEELDEPQQIHSWLKQWFGPNFWNQIDLNLAYKRWKNPSQVVK